MAHRALDVWRAVLCGLAAVALVSFDGLHAQPRSGGEQRLASAGETHRRQKSEDLERLEREAASAANDVGLRIRLLRHYFLERTPEARAARARHVLWVIANAPEEEIAGSLYAGFSKSTEPDWYAAARDLWRDHLARDGNNPRIVSNASRFFERYEPALAEELLRRGAELDPTNARWTERLARLTARQRRHQDSSRSPEPVQQKSGHALPASEIPGERLYALARRAEAALRAEEYEAAREHATELLRLAEHLPKDWGYGNAIHDGHRILGHLSLRANDVSAAKAHLIQAGSTPGSPQLNTFGPSLTLAQELLERGEPSVVIEYLTLCSRFWKERSQVIDEWIALILAGQAPELKRYQPRRSLVNRPGQ